MIEITHECHGNLQKKQDSRIEKHWKLYLPSQERIFFEEGDDSDLVLGWDHNNC